MLAVVTQPVSAQVSAVVSSRVKMQIALPDGEIYCSHATVLLMAHAAVCSVVTCYTMVSTAVTAECRATSAHNLHPRRRLH